MFSLRLHCTTIHVKFNYDRKLFCTANHPRHGLRITLVLIRSESPTKNYLWLCILTTKHQQTQSSSVVLNLALLKAKMLHASK